MKIQNEDQTQTFTVRPAHGRKWDHESFTFGMTTWDVTKLWNAVEEGRQVHTVDIESAYSMINAIMGVGLTPRDEDMTGEEYALSDQVDFTVPVLLAHWEVDPKEEPSTMVIDGWSRIFKAYRQGFRTLPCYVFTDQEVRDLKAIDDPIRRNRERKDATKTALAEIVHDFLDNLDRHLDRHQWKKFRDLDLLYSTEVDELAEIVESWKEGELDF